VSCIALDARQSLATVTDHRATGRAEIPTAWRSRRAEASPAKLADWPPTAPNLDLPARVSNRLWAPAWRWILAAERCRGQQTSLVVLSQCHE
jgi:hypothetical protein